MDKKEFFLLGFIMFLTMTGYGIILPTLPFLADRLHLTSFQMGTLITGWAFAQLVTAPIWGRLSDRIGRKPVLMSGLFGFGIAFLVLILAQSYLQLLLARMIGASLASGTYPAVFSVVADGTERAHRNIAIAQIGAINGLGFLCGPAVGGIFAPLGVDVPFIVAGSLALITLPFAWTFLKEPAKQETLTIKSTSFWRAFSMLSTSGYWQLYMITFGVSLAFSSFLGLLGYFMIARFQAAPGFVSAAFSAEAGMAVIVQFFVLQFLYRVWEEVKIKKSGLILIASGYGLIAVSPNAWIVIIGCMLVGTGQAFVIPTVVSLLTRLGKFGQGMTMGLQESMDSLGRMIGPLLGGIVYSIRMTAPFFGSALIALLLLVVVLPSAKSKLEVFTVQEKSH